MIVAALPSRVALAFALLLGSTATQTPLHLVTKGGSFPGTLQLSVSPGPFGGSVSILLSASRGPTSLAAIGEARSLQLGLDAFGNPIISGAFLPPTGTFRPPALAIPNNPSFLDAGIFFQAIRYPGASSPIADLSNPSAVYLAPAFSFRDRGRTMALPRAFAFSETLSDGRFFVIGGGQGILTGLQSFATTEIYDPYTDNWAPGPKMAVPHGIHRNAQLSDGRILVVAGVDGGGTEHNVCEMYDPGRNAFSTVAPCAKTRFAHTATALPNGKVLVAGGIEHLDLTNPLLTLLNALDETEIYDPATDTWTPGPRMNGARAGHWAQPLPNGKVLLAGGIGYRRVLGVPVLWIFDTCDLYDPATNTIAPAGKMSSPRSIFDMAALGNGRYLAAGGIASVSLSQPGIPTRSAEIYDSATDTWTPTGSLANAKALGYSYALCDGRIILIGGGIGSITAPAAVRETEIYDPASGTWSPGPNLNKARVAYTAFQSQSGQVLVCGGGTGSGAVIENTTEWFYP